MMKYILLICTVVFYSCQSLESVDKTGEINLLDAATTDMIDQVFDDIKSDGPGGAVAVIRDGQLVYAKGYGLADLEHGVPVTPSTVFYIGSSD
jgi:CubicO group peptidase (beta-lactamase class C family)